MVQIEEANKEHYLTLSKEELVEMLINCNKCLNDAIGLRIAINEYESPLKQDVLICACQNAEHQLVIAYDEFEYGQKEVVLEPYLITYNNFFKRLWVGLKYAFGHDSKYGQWESIIVNKSNVDKIKNIIKFIEQ